MTTQSFFDDQGRLDVTIIADNAGALTTSDYEAATGRLDYQFTTVPWTMPGPGYVYVSSATDYDLANEHPWASFTIRRALNWSSSPTIQNTETVMDDGSTTVVVPVMEALGFGRPFQVGQRATTTDALGRLDYVLETNMSGRIAQGEDFATATISKAYDYNPATGQLDHSAIDYRSGLKERYDFDPVTGLLQHQFTTFSDGRTVARDFDALGRMDYAVTSNPGGSVLAADYDPTTGNLDYTLLLDPDGHSLASDYAAATGRLAYTIERWADGRMTATDYDPADAHAWASYSIAYDAQGHITGTAML